MQTRKEMKKRGKHSLKKHYFMYVAVCLIAAYLGAEFTGSLDFINNNSQEVYYEDENIVTSVPMVLMPSNEGLASVLEAALTGNSEEGQKRAAKIQEKALEDAKDNQVLGRSRGVFAQIVNGITSGSLFVTLISAANSILGSHNLTVIILVFLSTLLTFAFWFFVKNIYTVISRRIFLEGRIYEKLHIQRFVFLFRVRKWTRASWTMFVTTILRTLWSLTIIGGFIKTYSYYLVPYIVAENPGIKALDAITLSRKMMQGHKWQCFVFDLSFIGWYILGILTIGLTDVFFANPYRVASFSEYFTQLRQLAKLKQIEGCQLLDDTYLFEKADLLAIGDAYDDVIDILARPVENLDEIKGIRGFLANWFGILLFYTKKERVYEESQAEQIRVRALKDAVEGLIYPDRLSPIPEIEKRKRVETLHYMRNYSIWSLILLFFIFSLIGWLWEVSLHLITEGEFVNRGVLHGPWLPIYGSGGLLILTILKKLRQNPVAEFFGTVILCGAVEYFTAYYLEMTHGGQKWWDYSGYFLNLHGRICAEGLLVFGLGGIMIAYVLAPMLDNHIKKISVKILIPICAVLLSIFITDQLYSSKYPNTGEGITSYEDARNWQQWDQQAGGRM